MRIESFDVRDNLELSDGAQLGDTFEIVGSARIIAIQEELAVDVWPAARDSRATAYVPARLATVEITTLRIA